MQTRVEISSDAAVNLDGPSLADGNLLSVEFMDGAFSVHTEGLISPMATKVFALRAIGSLRDEISERLGIHNTTINYHTNRVKQALETDTVRGAVHKAFGKRVFNVIKPATSCEPLLAQEKDVLERAALGYNYYEIGKQIWMSGSTVKSHEKRVRQKLGGAASDVSMITLGHLTGELQPEDVAAESAWTLGVMNPNPEADIEEGEQPVVAAYPMRSIMDRLSRNITQFSAEAANTSEE